jgi:hypothetical protein
MLSSGSGYHSYSPPAVLLWRWLFTVLLYYACFFALPPFSVWSANCLPSRFGVTVPSGCGGSPPQCNVAWRCFVHIRSSVCQSFNSPWCFISVKCGSSISARFLSHGAHTVCFCTIVTILDPPLNSLLIFFCLS